MRVAIYVQHLLGTGHLVRMQALAEALHNAGHETLLASGGRLSEMGPYRSLQLPVVKTLPGDFLTLLDENLNEVNDSWKADRTDLLVSAIQKFTPNIMVIETWPFGRRQMRFEILPLMQRLIALDTPPMIVSSIRDVLQRRKQKRRIQTLSEVERYIDLVLVHGEETLTPLSQSFEEAEELQANVAYSGYIATHRQESAKEEAPSTPSGEIVVSAGGGATGSLLLKTAARAAFMDTRSWRLLVGPNVEATVFDVLQKQQSSRLIVERNRKDFRHLLAHCAASVSQFGYNTALDLLIAGCPAVVVPYADDGETEQTQRAEGFEKRGYVVSIEQDLITPESLLSAIQKAQFHRTRENPSQDFNGAVHSVELLESHYQKFLRKNA
ncbi:MAG: hypothetical protein KTR18_05945 [Acidiferrobacterales bacterium]|nr:hypothetical protein [Acidiferrobacterales bacterium]